MKLYSYKCNEIRCVCIIIYEGLENVRGFSSRLRLRNQDHFSCRRWVSRPRPNVSRLHLCWMGVSQSFVFLSRKMVLVPKSWSWRKSLNIFKTFINDNTYIPYFSALTSLVGFLKMCQRLSSRTVGDIKSRAKWLTGSRGRQPLKWEVGVASKPNCNIDVWLYFCLSDDCWVCWDGRCWLLQPVWIQSSPTCIWAAVPGGCQLQDSVNDPQYNECQLCQQQTINVSSTAWLAMLSTVVC